MTTEDQIAGLLAQAEPLRALPDEEAEAKGLPAIVDAINALRAKLAVAQRDAHEAEFVAIAEAVNPKIAEYVRVADALGIPEEQRPAVTVSLDVEPDVAEAAEAFVKAEPVRRGRKSKAE